MTTVEHNETLSHGWFSKRGISPHIKPVQEQVKTVPFPHQALFANGYNPSIIRFEKRILMAYRYHTVGVKSALAIVEFDMAFNPIANKRIHISESEFGEDPKLFVHAGKLHVTWISVTMATYGVATVVRYAELIEGAAWKSPHWIVENIQHPQYGNNDWMGIEKNWVPFSHDGKVHFIYAHGEVISTLGGNWTRYPAQPLPGGWRYGEIKGGTSPLPYKGKWLRFAHSTLDNEPSPWHRRYYILAVVMEPEPPFTVLAISKEPIIRGSETGRVKREECGHFKANVVFVSGAIPFQNGVLLSLGINDAECVLAKLNEEELGL